MATKKNNLETDIFKRQFLKTANDIKREVKKLRSEGKRIVLTQGSYDMLHLGHARYLEKARSHGDILFVGIDSDKKVRKRKGKHRPVVPEKERLIMLSHLRSVDYVTLKHPHHKRWQLIRHVQPDVLIVSERMNYSDGDLKKLKKLCGEMIVLSSQATTSTSARIRLLHVGGADNVIKQITERFPQLVEEVFEEIKDGKI